MKKVALAVMAVCILPFSVYAHGGKKLGEKISGNFKIVVEIDRDSVVEKKSTNFEFEVSKGKDEVEDATISVSFSKETDGYVCSMKCAEVEKPGKCPKCGMKLEKGKIYKNIAKETKVQSNKHKQSFDTTGNYKIEINVQPKDGDSFTVAIPFSVEKDKSCACTKDMPDCDCNHCTASKDKQASIACLCSEHMDKKEHSDEHKEKKDDGGHEGHGCQH